MSAFELANKIFIVLEELHKEIRHPSLGFLLNDLTQLVDVFTINQNAYEQSLILQKENSALKDKIQKLKIANEINSLQNQDQQINNLLESLGHRSEELGRVRRWFRRQLEKIELKLYEINQYKLLQGIIRFVQVAKKKLEQKSYDLDSYDQSFKTQSFRSENRKNNNSTQNNCNQAFYETSLRQSPNNILNNTNNIIINGVNSHAANLQGLVAILNQSNLSLNRKEELYYKLMKSNQKSAQSSKLQHVQLQDLLNISCSNSQNSSIPYPTDKSPLRLSRQVQVLQNNSFPLRSEEQVMKSLCSNIEENNKSLSLSSCEIKCDNIIISPKFQLGVISPIKDQKLQKQPSKILNLQISGIKQCHNTWIDSFRNAGTSKASLRANKENITKEDSYNEVLTPILKDEPIRNSLKQRISQKFQKQMNSNHKGTLSSLVLPTSVKKKSQKSTDKCITTIQNKSLNLKQSTKNGQFFKNFMEKMMRNEPQKVKRTQKSLGSENERHCQTSQSRKQRLSKPQEVVLNSLIQNISKDVSQQTAKRKIQWNESLIQNSSAFSHKLSGKNHKY